MNKRAAYKATLAVLCILVLPVLAAGGAMVGDSVLRLVIVLVGLAVVLLVVVWVAWREFYGYFDPK